MAHNGWTRPRTYAGFVALAGLAAMVLVPQASATLRVESTGSGLVLLDKTGTLSDQVILDLVQQGPVTEWEIRKSFSCGTDCTDIVPLEFSPGCRLGGALNVARCDRLTSKVTVTLLGGNDDFLAETSGGLTITDPLSIDLGAGNDKASAGSGPDTMQGGSGNDELKGKAGSDVLTGGAGNDRLRLGTGADNANGGTGNDEIFMDTPARDETDQVNGGVGSDSASYSSHVPVSFVARLTPLRIIEGNLQTLAGEKDTPENDVLASIETYRGGEGNDIITGVLSSNAGTYDGLIGADQLFGTSGSNTLIGGAGADQLSGKAGNDLLDAKTGEGSFANADPVIDCGVGADLAILDLTDDPTPTSCEGIDRSPIREGPHVIPTFGRVVHVADGGVSPRLTCPRVLRRACAGTLALRLGRARTARSSYRIRPGRSKRVLVHLGALENRIGRRTVGTLVSLERGIHGRKTTTRRIVLSG